MLVTVNDAPALFVYDRCPSVPPEVDLLIKMRLLAVTDVFETVTVPATRVAVPCLQFDPSLTEKPTPDRQCRGERSIRDPLDSVAVQVAVIAEPVENALAVRRTGVVEPHDRVLHAGRGTVQIPICTGRVDTIDDACGCDG